MIGNLTLDQLRMLAAVAETGSFSAAGRRVGRVQSAVSQSMQALEAALGLSLFDRSGKIPALTKAGLVLVTQARLILAQVDTLESQAAAIATGLEPQLTIAVDNLFPSAPLLTSLRAFRLQFPHLPVTLYTEPISASERRLRDGGADIALCGLPLGSSRDLVAEPLTWIDMTPVVAPDHPLAAMPGPITRSAHVWRDQPPGLAVRRSRSAHGFFEGRVRLGQHACSFRLIVDPGGDVGAFGVGGAELVDRQDSHACCS